MPSVGVFRSLGLFVADDFCTEHDCREYQDAIERGTVEYAAIRTRDSVDEVNENRRKVHIAEVSTALKSRLKAQLRDVKPSIEAHFHIPLADCESPQFLTYGPGHFYVPHTDSTDDAAAPAEIKQRKISVVVFLNASTTTPDSQGYDGGALVFYGLIRMAAFAACGLPLEARAGMLVAFPSNVVHEVRPVTRGRRLTIATWFPGANAVA